MYTILSVNAFKPRNISDLFYIMNITPHFLETDSGPTRLQDASRSGRDQADSPLCTSDPPLPLLLEEVFAWLEGNLESMNTSQTGVKGLNRTKEGTLSRII